MSKSDDIKKTYLAMLVKIGDADGYLDNTEEKYIDTIARQLNIPDADLIKIKENPDINKYVLPDTYTQRIEFFYNLLFMMGINNNFTKQEKELCKRIGFKLCFNPMLMDDLIKIMVDSLGKNVPVNKVIEAVIKYQN